MKRGTVLMETVLVLPILTLLIFAIVQFALIWYARIMTQYAAYNAARAALVYHPGEYRITDKAVTDKFKQHEGPCWKAACRTLAWVSSSPDWPSDSNQSSSTSSNNKGSLLRIPGWYDPIPNSAHIEQQVRIMQSESTEMTNAPVVKVTVEFDYPLHVPVIGRMLAYFDKVEQGNPSKYEVWGWQPDATGLAKLDNLHHRTMNVDYITLRATAILPKLWRTSHFARIPDSNDESDMISGDLNIKKYVILPAPSNIADGGG